MAMVRLGLRASDNKLLSKCFLACISTAWRFCLCSFKNISNMTTDMYTDFALFLKRPNHHQGTGNGDEIAGAESKRVGASGHDQ